MLPVPAGTGLNIKVVHLPLVAAPASNVGATSITHGVLLPDLLELMNNRRMNSHLHFQKLERY